LISSASDGEGVNLMRERPGRITVLPVAISNRLRGFAFWTVNVPKSRSATEQLDHGTEREAEALGSSPDENKFVILESTVATE
jgi:hypothetical protein